MAIQAKTKDLSFFKASVTVNCPLVDPAHTMLVFFRIKACKIAGWTFHSVGYVGKMFSFLIIFAILHFFPPSLWSAVWFESKAMITMAHRRVLLPGLNGVSSGHFYSYF